MNINIQLWHACFCCVQMTPQETAHLAPMRREKHIKRLKRERTKGQLQKERGPRKRNQQTIVDGDD